jgi:catechol 2,3-dioxygenase-like lactoylglutathione lyase family enzyme
MTPALSGTPVTFLYVSDRARTLAFYGETLGLAVRSADSDEYGEVLDLGGALLRVTVMADHKPHPHPVLGWNVPDIGAAAEALSARGISLAIYEGMGQDARGIWSAPDGKTKLAWFADPDGNMLMLSEG